MEHKTWLDVTYRLTHPPSYIPYEYLFMDIFQIWTVFAKN